MTVDELADAIAALSLDEVRALLDALRTRLAIEDERDARWRWAVPAYGNPPPPWGYDEDWRAWAVHLSAVGPRRALVITQLRAVMALTLPEAKAWIDKAPCELGVFEDPDRARAVCDVLREAGASAEVRKADVPSGR